MPFIDVYMPEEVPGYPCISAPRWKTSIRANASGKESRNQEWEHPLHDFFLPEAVAREFEVIQGLSDHWKITRGPFKSFPWRDPLDKASIPNIPNEPDDDLAARVSMSDQLLGTGTGFTDSYQLIKIYSRDGETYQRSIYLPVTETLKVSVNGVLKTQGVDYTVTRVGGVITFTTPPPNGHAVRAGYLFDVEVRFKTDDQLEGIVRTWQAGGFADLELVEVRPC